jgi:biopolymer transport protein ExbD
MIHRPSRRKRHKTEFGEARLQLTSMMDMFTIILVFLLKIYSSHGQLITPSGELQLPEARAENAPDLELEVVVSKERILVNGLEVELIRNIESNEVYIISALKTALEAHARELEEQADRFGLTFDGRVLIQGDRELSYSTLIKVMATCGQSRFPNMRLIVYNEEG